MAFPPAAATVMELSLAMADDPIWTAILASPVLEDELSDAERAAVEEGSPKNADPSAPLAAEPRQGRRSGLRRPERHG